MPLTSFQKSVFTVIRDQRTPQSFVYGAIALHHGEEAPRYSRDIDLCHDLAESVASSAEQDSLALTEAGFTVRWLIQQPTFQRATIQKEEENVVLEWVADSAFRFFPIEPDPELGYRLHKFDAATNKILALAGRAEPRDFVDALHLHQGYLSLGSLAWAASGKDEGLNPQLILELADRFAHYRQVDIDSLALTVPLDITALKACWRTAMTEALSLFATLPTNEIGAVYINAQGHVTEATSEPLPSSERRPHYGSVRGTWPRIG